MATIALYAGRINQMPGLINDLNKSVTDYKSELAALKSEGFENGAFSGAITGIISGGMGFALSLGGTVALTLGKTMLIGAVSGAVASIASDIGDIVIKGADISFVQMLLNMGFSAALGATFAGIGYALSKGFQTLKLRLGGTKNANSGPVEFTTPRNNATPENIVQTKEYVKGCNEALKDGALSPTGRVSTKGQLGKDAAAAAKAERIAAAAAGIPYKGHAGHVPDTTWTAAAQPHSWLDLNASVNSSLGAQALNYPIGYQPTKFIFNNPCKYNNFHLLWGALAKPILSGLNGN